MTYQNPYAEFGNGGQAKARAEERLAIGMSITKLKLAQAAGPESRETTEAIFFLHQLWTYLIEALADTDNGLDPALRANLISVGLWLLRESEGLRTGLNTNFSGLIEVSETLHDAFGGE